jgi:hypothetical protein
MSPEPAEQCCAGDCGVDSQDRLREALFGRALGGYGGGSVCRTASSLCYGGVKHASKRARDAAEEEKGPCESEGDCDRPASVGESWSWEDGCATELAGEGGDVYTTEDLVEDEAEAGRLRGSSAAWHSASARGDTAEECESEVEQRGDSEVGGDWWGGDGMYEETVELGRIAQESDRGGMVGVDQGRPEESDR